MAACIAPLQPLAEQLQLNKTSLEAQLADVQAKIDELTLPPPYDTHFADALVPLQYTRDRALEDITAITAVLAEIESLQSADAQTLGFLQVLFDVLNISAYHFCAKALFNWQSIVSDPVVLQLYNDDTVPKAAKDAMVRAKFDTVGFHRYGSVFLSVLLRLE